MLLQKTVAGPERFLLGREHTERSFREPSEHTTSVRPRLATQTLPTEITCGPRTKAARPLQAETHLAVTSGIPRSSNILRTSASIDPISSMTYRAVRQFPRRIDVLT